MTADVTPIEFEGQPLPRPEELADALRIPIAERRWLVRAAISVPTFAEAIANQASLWAQDEGFENRVDSLWYGHTLGLKSVARDLAATLDSAPEAWLGVPGVLGTGQTLAQEVVAYILRVAPPGTAPVSHALAFALAHEETRILGWQALPPDELPQAIPWARTLLTESPDLANQLASRFALLARDICPELCATLAPLPDDTKLVIANTLRKNLKRMGKVRLWVACREALKGGEPPRP